MIHTVHIPRSAPWLPPSLLGNPEPIKHRVAITDAEKRVFRRHRKIPVSQWAEKYRYVTMSVLPGRWRNETAPYLAGIMDASFNPAVQTVIICKAPQIGGPLSLDTPIPTINGWTTMGKIKTGDIVFNEKGAPCEVTFVSEIFKGRDCYEITFSDGSKIISDASHLWRVTDDKNRRRPQTRTTSTEEMLTTYKRAEGNKIRNRYAIPVVSSLQLEQADLPIAPYALGVWLGDGNKASNQITSHDDDVVEIASNISVSGHHCDIRKETWCKGKVSNIIIEKLQNADHKTCIRGHNLAEAGTYRNKKGVLVCRICIRQAMRKYRTGVDMDPVLRTTFYRKLQILGLINNKHIPEIYLRASYRQRLELLQGLMDTDGNIDKDGGHCEITIADRQLCDGIYELLMTLGIKATCSTRNCLKTGWGIIKNPHTHYRISFTVYADKPIFKLRRKKTCMIPLEKAGRPTKTNRRRIVKIHPVPSVPVRCISVATENHLYLAGKSMIPTHNTEAVLTCLAYAIDRDPGPVLCIYPDELTARENNQDRIQPMIYASPRLKYYMTGSEDDAGMMRIKLTHMPIYMAWARSASRLANKPIRYVIFDETDKYPDTAGKRETDPISLGEARTITYRYNRKIWKISTPTDETGNIYQALTNEAKVIFDYHVDCPFCGHHHRMKFSGDGQNGQPAYIRWPHEEEPGPDGKCHSLPPETIESEKSAWYECPQCAAKWTDYDRDRAIRHGKWRDRAGGIEISEYLRVHRPMKIGFHVPSWISPFVSFSTIAAAFLKGQTDINKLKDFANKHAAEPWKITIISKSAETILSARSDIPPQTVPESAIALTCGIDVQQTGFWFVVRAWSATLTSWCIHYGFLQTWEDIERLIFDTYYPQQGTSRNMRIFRAIVDTGGGKKYENMTMTEETYFWLLKNIGRGGVALWGSKGSSTPLSGMLNLGNPILSTPSGKKLTQYLRLLIVDTDKAKDQYHYRLGLATSPNTRDLPGAAYLHSATGQDYAIQILSEEKQLVDGKEQWVHIHSRPNHLLDADCLACACVEMEFPGGGLRLLAEGARRVQAIKPSDQKKPNINKKSERW